MVGCYIQCPIRLLFVSMVILPFVSVRSSPHLLYPGLLLGYHVEAGNRHWSDTLVVFEFCLMIYGVRFDISAEMAHHVLTRSRRILEAPFQVSHTSCMKLSYRDAKVSPDQVVGLKERDNTATLPPSLI